MAEYIDREKITYSKQTMEAWFGCQRDDYNAMVAFKDDIDKITAADVRPVVRGKWEPGDIRNVTAVCSNCGHLRLGNGAEWATKIALFCERCGADMRAEEGEG